MMPLKDSSLRAEEGERMIEIKVRFWTNNIASSRGRVIPKHAWTSGVVRMERNKTHGINPDKPEPFHTLTDLPAVLEKVLIRHGVTLHLSKKMAKFVSPRP